MFNAWAWASAQTPESCACHLTSQLMPADASTADFNSSVNDFPEFGPLRSFTPMVSQNGGRSNPFATGGSSNGYADRSSLRNSQDISMLLRSGMLMEAALLSSNASRMHVIHDAGGYMYAAGPDGSHARQPKYGASATGSVVAGLRTECKLAWGVFLTLTQSGCGRWPFRGADSHAY